MTFDSIKCHHALDSKAGWQVIATAMLGLAFGPSAVVMLSFGVLSSVIQREYGWPVSDMSLGASLASIMIVVLAPIQGWLVDRYGARKVILPSLPLWALALFGIAMTPNSLPIFLILCMLFPIAAIGLWPLSFLSLPAGWFEKRLGIAVGVTNLGIGLGAAIVPLIMGYAIAHNGWRWGYAGIGMLVLFLVLPLSFVFLRDGMGRDANRSVPSSHPAKLPLNEAVRLPGFAILASSFFILGLTGTSLLVHMVPLLNDSGLTQSEAIRMQAVLGFGTMFGRLVAGWLLDRYSVRTIGLGVFAVGAITALILSTGPMGWVAPLSTLLFGLVVGAEFDVMAVAIRRMFGLANFGRIYGITYAVFQLGSAIGSWALGVMRTQMGSYGPAMLLFAVLLLGGLLIFSRLIPNPDASSTSGFV